MFADEIDALLRESDRTVAKDLKLNMAGLKIRTALRTSASGYSEALQRAWRRNCYSWMQMGTGQSILHGNLQQWRVIILGIRVRIF